MSCPEIDDAKKKKKLQTEATMKMFVTLLIQVEKRAWLDYMNKYTCILAFEKKVQNFPMDDGYFPT